MKMRLLIITLSLMLHTASFADPAGYGTRLMRHLPSQMQDGPIYLYDIDSHRATVVKTAAKLLPWRVYLVPDGTGSGHLGYAITNSEGKLAQPGEIFRERTILAGRNLGSRHQRQNYELTKEGAWVPTAMLERFYFWVLSTPPVIKVVGWFELPPERAPASSPSPKFTDLQEYDPETNTGKSVSSIRILPNRIYRVIEGPAGTPRFMVSNFEARFPAPAEFLFAGTVYKGHAFGSKSMQRFLLDRDGKWGPTGAEETRLSWVSTSPGHVQTVWYIEPDPVTVSKR